MAVKANPVSALFFGFIEGLKNGKRSLYWRSLKNAMVWSTAIGTAEIVGDKMCSKWTFGPQKCYDNYRVGEDKYESWSGGMIDSPFYPMK